MLIRVCDGPRLMWTSSGAPGRLLWPLV